MDGDTKALVIIIALAIGLPMIGLALSDLHRANVKIACYEAMKTNPKLECK